MTVTKVEESFNVQACYDLLFKSWRNVKSFDHIEFPGVVPRTFIGPLYLTAIARPLISIFSLSRLTSLLVVRGVLSATLCLTFVHIRMSATRTFSARTGTLFMLLTAVQFHLAFYSSRLLPNMFAMCLTNIALAAFMPCVLDIDRAETTFKLAYSTLSILSVTIALFRSEVVLLLFPVFIIFVMEQRVQMWRAVGVCLLSAVLTALASIGIDSMFWQRRTYPELEVFVFNAIKGKSSAWGTSPFNWYWVNALPRTLGGAYILALLAMQQKRIRRVITPAIFFITAYSYLPHKETRFIFYSLPFFNVCAAKLLDDALCEAFETLTTLTTTTTNSPTASDGESQAGVVRGWKKMGYMMMILALGLVSVLGSVAQTVVSLHASQWNYPSGHALRWLTARDGAEATRLRGLQQCGEATIHIDAASAMQGISQFVHEDGGEDEDGEEEGCGVRWTYSKDEAVDHGGDEDLGKRFAYVVSERDSVAGYEVIHGEEGYAGMDMSTMTMRTGKQTHVHRRRTR